MTVTGALVFGVVVGYLTYRTLVRAEQTAISDLNAIIAAIGGGAVTQLFAPSSDVFAWYAIGLAGGLALFFTAFWKLNGKAELAKVMGGRATVTGSAPGDGGPQT
jgi:hypothetical protein